MGGLTLEQAHTRGFELVRIHAHRFIEYLQGLRDDDLGRPVPGLTWTVGETVSHVQSVFERYTVDRRRAPTPEGVGAQNAADIARLGTDLDASIKSIEEQLAAMAMTVNQVAPARLFPFHAGLQTTFAGGWGNLLGELLAHGDDIARSTGQPYGLPGEDLEVFWRFTAPLLQGWLRPEAAARDESWSLHFPFGQLQAVLERGVLHWGDDDAARPATHQIYIDDIESFTLAFPYRRRPVVDAATALLAECFYDV